MGLQSTLKLLEAGVKEELMVDMRLTCGEISLWKKRLNLRRLLTGNVNWREMICFRCVHVLF